MSGLHAEKRKYFLGLCYRRSGTLLSGKKRLKWLEREGLVKTWHEYNISAGAEREKEIHRHLELADIILLFVSADFIDTDFCYCDQLKQAMKRHQQKNHVLSQSSSDLSLGKKHLLVYFKLFLEILCLLKTGQILM